MSPISIAGSGTITGISAGGLPDDCITTAEIAANAVTYAKIGTTEQGQLCKAWVNFNGTGTVAIRASYNVSSITDNGVGVYTVNFANALADTNYSVVFAGSDSNYGSVVTIAYDGTYTTNGTKIRIASNFNSMDADIAVISLAIFR
jgi:hypothetical protein